MQISDIKDDLIELKIRRLEGTQKAKGPQVLYSKRPDIKREGSVILIFPVTWSVSLAVETEVHSSKSPK